MHHRVDVVLVQEAAHQGAVQDVALHKHVPGIVLQGAQAGEVARVSQFVQVHDLLDRHAALGACLSQQVVDEVGADKASSAGDKDAQVVV